jgi:eukaryotic-like serine/threonine-protein kinase
MSDIKFHHICQVFGGCVINIDEVWLVLEFAEGGDLLALLTKFGPLPWETQLSFAIQATKAVNYLHSQSPPILHRDIKACNFLITEKSKLLLTDFGKAKKFVQTHSATVGTLNWSAPEILKAEPEWTDKTDIYSLGMVFFEIVSCEVPFQTESNWFRIANKIKAGIRPSIPTSCPKACTLHNAKYN